jgi:endonuclease/exonuclease/phosphatase family metal-dependent hydrolase
MKEGPGMSRLFTVMTYNVHSCVGADRRSDPVRIAHVIAGHQADIVALQELDMGLERTGLSDQAREIAEHLSMHYHFHPSLSVEKGHYGNAVLSRLPLKLVRTAELPTHPYRADMERRGVLWVEISFGGAKVQVINTHLGLNHQERLAQAETLLSAEFLNNPDCRPPVVLCGDLNSLPVSRVRRWLTGRLNDAGEKTENRRATYPARFPLLRLDYIFGSHDLKIRKAAVSRDSLARVASDHLPFIALLELS